MFGLLVCLCILLSVFRLGSVLGLSVCLSALCGDSKPQGRVHASQTLEKLTQQLETCEPTDPNYEVSKTTMVSK